MIDRLFKRSLTKGQRASGSYRRAARPGTGVLAAQREQVRSRRFPTFAAFGAVLGILLGAILAVPLSPITQIALGEPSPVSVRAPRTISYQSDVLTNQQREAEANNPALVSAQIDTTLPILKRAELSQLLDTIDATRSNVALDTPEREQALVGLEGSLISPTLASQIAVMDDARWSLISGETTRVYNELWSQDPNGISESDIAIIRSTTLPSVPLDAGLAQADQDLVRHFVSAFLTANLIVDQQETQTRREAARSAVEPAIVTVQEGENVVREGDYVTDIVYEKLQQFGLVFGAGGITALLQQFLMGALVAWLLSSYLYFYQSDLATNRRGLMIIGSVAIVTMLAARILVPAWEPAPYGFPLAVVGVLLTLLFDRQLGLVLVLALAPLVGLQAEDSIGLTLTMALGGAAGVFATQRAVRSVMFVWVCAAVSIVTALTASIFWFDQLETTAWTQAISIPLFSLLNGTLAGALALGTYQLLARIARITTPVQLMELAYSNQPLLNRLMREAPGTHHHSVVVANLAEVAAQDIGADPLLARVGAYYHDIGKMIRPYFFTDNQYDRSNVHDELDAKTSATLIIDHVRDGVKLAREHGLPQEIIDFIAQHHGTMIVSYFYQRAVQEDGDVNIEDFRYPGPKPQHRETGIMMLADGVEAAVRANVQTGKLKVARPDDAERESNGSTISEMVEQIVSDRLNAGQLDECPLTLHDVSIIKQSFVQTLQGIYHPRVEYPPTARQPTPEPATDPV